MADEPIFDRATFGRLLRAARIIAGFDSVAEAAAEITKRTGVAVSDRTIYALERGEQDPTAPQFLAVAVTFRPPGGEGYWSACMRSDVLAYYAESRLG